MIRRAIRRGSSVLERLALVMAFRYFSRKRRGRTADISWIIGPYEIASMVRQLKGVIPNSHSVSLGASAFYGNVSYDSVFPAGLATGRGPVAAFRRITFAPILLARLAARARGVIYIGPAGFLRYGGDEREYEYRFLKRHGLKIAPYWCGSDIRSPLLMAQLEQDTGTPNIFSYIGAIAPSLTTVAHDNVVKRRAALSDRFADIVFDFPADQKNYITAHTEPFYYFMADAQFEATENKFENLDRIVVSHAASSPIIKGTQLVRSAVARLRAEGYEFEYVEMLNFSNDELLAQLRRTHIALNQFYGFTPAVFGCEALAARCAVLQSADGITEPRIPPHAASGWMITKHYEVYEHLKTLLDNPTAIEAQATRGQEWARKYCSVAETGKILNELLDSVLDDSYDPVARAADPESAYELQGASR